MKRLLPGILSAFMALLAGSAAAIEIKIATVAPDGTFWMEEMRAGGERIRELTDGRVEFKFYPGGVMGTDSQVLRKIRVGQLQGGAFTAGGLSERYNGLNTYGIPLLFRSLDEVDYVRQRLDGKINAGIAEAGFVSLGLSEGGFANLLSNEPVSHVNDLRRQKVWVPEGDQISYLVMESLGLSPVVLPVTEVLTSLQTGLLDVVFNSPVGALILQWHTKVKYRTELPIAYSLGVFAVDQRVFRQLSAEDQAVVRAVIGETMATIDGASRRDNEDSLEAMNSIGVIPVPVDSSDVVGWRQSIESLYPAIRERPDIDVALFDEMIELLEEYRDRSPDSQATR